MTESENKRKSLFFTAVLQPEDYGPVVRCLIIQALTEEDHLWVQKYRFPGPIRTRFRSDAMGNPHPQGNFETVFPISGPEIQWTQAFVYDQEKERNMYRKWQLPGLSCSRVVCPAADQFIRRRACTCEGITMQYRDYLPEAYRDRKGVRGVRKGTLPLIIWLHGLGEGGKDPTLVLLGNRVTALAEATVQCYFPETGAAVLAPQCPTMWMDADGKGFWNDWDPVATDGRSFYTEALRGLILKYLKSHPEIDRSRIYIGGCSNGGYMTLNMILAMPGFFAAAFPVCPAYNALWMTPERIAKLAEVPIWVIAAATDTTVPLRDKQGNAAYADALYEKMTAYRAWDEARKSGSGEETTDTLVSGEENACISLPDFVYSRLPQVMGFTSGGFPYEYFGHWSWIPVLQDRITREFDGEEIHLFEWLAAKHL